MLRRWAVLALTAACALTASAQTRVAVAPVEGVQAPVAPASGRAILPGGAVPALTPGLTAAPSAFGLSAAPSAWLPAAAALAAPAAAPAPRAAPALRAAPAVSAAVSAPASAAAVPLSAPAAERPADARTARAVAAVAAGAASWESRRAEELPAVLAAADGPAAKSAPLAPAPAPGRARPGLAKASLALGASLLGTAAAAVAAPHMVPAALASVKGALAYGGFAFLAASRLWRAPTDAPAGPAATPETPKTGTFATFRALWSSATKAADSQARLEARVGAGSWTSFRDWLAGGLRSALFWLPVSLLAMTAGAVVGKLGGLAAGAHAAAAAAPLGLMKMSLLALALGPVATNLIETAMSLFAFDAARAVLTRLGAGRAAAPVAAVLTLAAAGVALAGLTQSPFVIAASLAVSASTLWLRTCSSSWLAPLALGGIFSVLSLDSARIGVWLKHGAGGALQTLPAVWTGAAVALILAGALVWSARSIRPSTVWRTLKEHLAAVSEFGAAWRAPAAGDAPKSPWRLLRLAGLWGLVTYALGDLTYWAVHAAAAGAEPAPAILARMLTSPVDLVLYNFLFVGFFEEFVFRRGVFRSIRDRLAKWGLTAGRAFWTAAVVSAVIFSGAHYVDYGAVLGKLGLGAALDSSGLGGSYAFSWAGFVSRGVLGVLMAWLYQRSGILALPALAHAAADTLEGLGLRWGLAAFLGMAALVAFAQKIGEKAKAAVLPETPAYKALRTSLVLGGFAAALAPVVWGAAPVLKGFFLLGTMSVSVLAVVAVINGARWWQLRRGAKPKPWGWRRGLAAVLIGLTLGTSLGIAPQVATAPLGQAMYAFSDAVNQKRSDVRAIPGDAMGEATVAVLSQNPVGRDILSRLHDRGGVLRLPSFFLRSSGDDPALTIVAQHEGFTDGLYIGVGALNDHGWSVEEFLRRPDWQRRLVEENQETIAHELLHAVQARRSPFARETWLHQRMETEYEAYATELMYVHERLKADPEAAVNPSDYWEYVDALEKGLTPALRAHDADYPQDKRMDGPVWREFSARAEARWAAARVEGFMTLAARFADHPKVAASYAAKARAAAAAAGLPDPAPASVAASGR